MKLFTDYFIDLYARIMLLASRVFSHQGYSPTLQHLFKYIHDYIVCSEKMLSTLKQANRQQKCVKFL